VLVVQLVGREMKKEDVIREIMSMRERTNFQVAKSIFRLATQPEGTFQQIGKRSTGKRPMSQAEAKRIVDAAKDRIALVDSDD
jgi:hypothetical protein